MFHLSMSGYLFTTDKKPILRKGTLQMEKNLIFNQTDMLYTVAGASVLTTILYFIMSV